MVSAAVISNQLISSSDLQKHLSSIFPNSIILDIRFRFVTGSESVFSSLGYALEELAGKDVSLIFRDGHHQELERKLDPGFFEEHRFHLRTRDGNVVPFGISGFYLGWLTDVNGLIILKFRNLEEVDRLKRRLEAKEQEMDHFIYHSSHALRGPLATLAGLIYVARRTQSKKELSYMLQKMDVFASELDEKLHRLISYADADKDLGTLTHPLPLETIAQNLHEFIEVVTLNEPVQFHCATGDPDLEIEDGEVILSALRNLVWFYCKQTKDTTSRLTLSVVSEHLCMKICIGSTGIHFPDGLVQKILHADFGYPDVLNNPEMTHYYTAWKILRKLNATLKFEFTEGETLSMIICRKS